jgi:rare lipoprotein A
MLQPKRNPAALACPLLLLCALSGAGLAGCEADAASERAAVAGDPDAMLVELVEEELPEIVLESQTGEATYYADVLELKLTASGEPLDQNAMVAAHRKYAFGTILRVTNLENQRSVRVRVIDRGPFGKAKKAREKVIDLSRRAAGDLGFLDAGRALVRVDVLRFGDGVPAAGG